MCKENKCSTLPVQLRRAETNTHTHTNVNGKQMMFLSDVCDWWKSCTYLLRICELVTKVHSQMANLCIRQQNTNMTKCYTQLRAGTLPNCFFCSSSIFTDMKFNEMFVSIKRAHKRTQSFSAHFLEIRFHGIYTSLARWFPLQKVLSNFGFHHLYICMNVYSKHNTAAVIRAPVRFGNIYAHALWYNDDDKKVLPVCGMSTCA